MDAAGAERLRWRIEQQQHWRLAPAVLEGVQPSTDPDLQELVDFADGIRLYGVRHTRDGDVRMCKRLVDGQWEHGILQVADESEPVAAADPLAHVA